MICGRHRQGPGRRVRSRRTTGDCKRCRDHRNADAQPSEHKAHAGTFSSDGFAQAGLKPEVGQSGPPADVVAALQALQKAGETVDSSSVEWKTAINWYRGSDAEWQKQSKALETLRRRAQHRPRKSHGQQRRLPHEPSRMSTFTFYPETHFLLRGDRSGGSSTSSRRLRPSLIPVDKFDEWRIKSLLTGTNRFRPGRTRGAGIAITNRGFWCAGRSRASSIACGICSGENRHMTPATGFSTSARHIQNCSTGWPPTSSRMAGRSNDCTSRFCSAACMIGDFDEARAEWDHEICCERSPRRALDGRFATCDIAVSGQL